MVTMRADLERGCPLSQVQFRIRDRCGPERHRFISRSADRATMVTATCRVHRARLGMQPSPTPDAAGQDLRERSLTPDGPTPASAGAFIRNGPPAPNHRRPAVLAPHQEEARAHEAPTVRPWSVQAARASIEHLIAFAPGGVGRRRNCPRLLTFLSPASACVEARGQPPAGVDSFAHLFAVPLTTLFQVVARPDPPVS